MENKAKSIILENISETPCFVMEFPCPKCGKDIRVLDGHFNNVFQLATCQNCGIKGMLMSFQKDNNGGEYLPFYEFINHNINYHVKLANEMAYLPTGIAMVELKDDQGDSPDDTFVENMVPETTLFFFASMVSPTEEGMRIVVKKGVYPRGETVSSIILPYHNCCYNTVSSFAFSVGRELQGYAYLLPWTYTESEKYITKIGNPGDKIDSVSYNIVFNNGGLEGSFEPGIAFGGSISIINENEEIKNIPVLGQTPLSFFESLNLLKKHKINIKEMKEILLYTINAVGQSKENDRNTDEIEKALFNLIISDKTNLN